MKFIGESRCSSAALSLSMAVLVLGLLPAPTRAGTVQTAEGCAVVVSPTAKQTPKLPSWSGGCSGGLISGVGRLRSHYFDSNGNVQEQESWYDAKEGTFKLEHNPYYFQGISAELTSYWRSRPGGYNDRISEAECKTLPDCNRILEARVALLGAAQAAKQSTDGDAALAAEQREQAAMSQGKTVDYAAALARAATIGAAGIRGATTGTASTSQNTYAASSRGANGANGANGSNGAHASVASGANPSPGAEPRNTGPEFTNIPSQTGCLSIHRGPEDKYYYRYEIQNRCASTVKAHWCSTPGCRRANTEWTIASGDKFSAATSKSSGGFEIGVLHGCQLKSGPYPVQYNPDTNQCFTQILK